MLVNAHTSDGVRTMDLMRMSFEERLGSHLKRVEQELNVVKTAAVKPAGLTVPQYAALFVLDDQPGISAAELADGFETGGFAGMYDTRVYEHFKAHGGGLSLNAVWGVMHQLGDFSICNGHGIEQFIAGDHPGQREPKLGSALGGRLDQFFGLEHLERYNAGGHRKIVFRKCGAMHNGAIHLIEDLVENVLAREQRTDRNMAA